MSTSFNGIAGGVEAEGKPVPGYEYEYTSSYDAVQKTYTVGFNTSFENTPCVLITPVKFGGGFIAQLPNPVVIFDNSSQFTVQFLAMASDGSGLQNITSAFFFAALVIPMPRRLPEPPIPFPI
jgi:hypothetical protein